jgi:spermidine synthase
VFALALVLVAVPGLGSLRFLLVPAAVAASLAIPPAAIGADVKGGHVIFETETPYQYVRVVQFADGTRWLQLNEGVAVHSVYRPGAYLTGGYWDDPLVLPFADGAGPPRRIAILGDAAGTVARAYGHYYPATRVDAVELDGELTTIGRRYFGLSGPSLHTYTADARPWLAASHARYDMILLDAYRQPYIPFYLLTHEFFDDVRQHLNPDGVLIVNVGHLPNSDALEKVVSATLGSAFPVVIRDRVSADNTLVVASRRPLSARLMLAAHARVPADLQGLLAGVAGRLGPALRGGQVYTDDLAPVEWLTDLSIIRYAAGAR